MSAEVVEHAAALAAASKASVRVLSAFDLAPSQAYDCRVYDAQNNLIGQLTYTPGSPATLDIAGAIYFDGPVIMDGNDDVVYRGRGTIYAETFDHHMFVNNLLILPLTFLGGVFYSIASLPSPWQEISHANPIFYLISAVRYGFLGTADVSVALALGITAALAAAAVAWSSWLFATGRRLKA